MRERSNEHHEQVEMRAYELWEERGRPLGSPEDDWFLAEQEVMQRSEWPSRLPFSVLLMEPVEN